jgi:S1-C subfamily serine protease
VTSVEGPAAYSGLREGDLIVEVNRKSVESLSELRKEVLDGPRSALVAVRRAQGTLFVAVPKDASGKGDSY